MPAQERALVCFLAYAGGSARRVFGNWEAELAPYADSLFLELPGHGSRSAERPVNDPAAVVRELRALIHARPHAVVGLVGHSLGGLLAYETAAALERLNGRHVAFTVVSGVGPAREADLGELALDDDALITSLVAWGATPRGVLESPELLELVLPLLRADLVLGSRCAADLVPLSGRLIAVTGEADPECPPSGLGAWRPAAPNGFEALAVPGGHLYLTEEPGRRFLIDLVRREISAGLTRQGPAARSPREDGRGLSMLPMLSALAAAEGISPSASVIDAGGQTAMSTVHRDARTLAFRLRHPTDTDTNTADTPVILALPRSRALVTAYLGAFLAGTTFVPVDPEQPAARIASIVRDSGARRVVTSLASPAWAEDLEILRPADFLDSLVEHQVATPLDVDRPAYIVYTSGSTGTPKGVLVPQRGLDALLEWHLGAYPETADGCVSVTASPGFDASIWEHFHVLAAGVSIHMPTDEERIAPADLQTAWRRHGVTQAFVAPQTAQQLFTLDWDAQHDKLRTLFCGGDALRTRPAPGLPFTVVNAYGPSECTVVATVGVVEPETPENRSVRPDIGLALPTVHTMVLDEALKPVPVGEQGALWLGGPQVAIGYLGIPEETAARFREGADLGRPGIRFYCTGDLVSEGADGRLAFHGRTDGQVKVDGVRIEVGEVEAALARHPDVIQAYVRPLTHPLSGATRLCASVSVRDGLDRAELRRWARERLSRPMVPVSFILSEHLPVTLNGKVDAELVEQQHLSVLRTLGERKAGTESPGGPAGRGDAGDVDGTVEAICARAVRTAFGHAVDPAIPLADAGLTSLAAVQAAGMISAATGRRVPSRLVMEADSLFELSAAVEALALDGGHDAPEMLPAGPWVPATASERSMWYLWRRDPASPEYTIGVAWVFDGLVAAARLEAALGSLLAALPQLRVTFRATATGGLDKRAVPLDPTDALDGWYESRSVAAVPGALELVQAWHQKPFDLDGGPLTRWRSITCGTQASVVQLIMHHSIADGVSIQEIRDLLRELYAKGGPAETRRDQDSAVLVQARPRTVEEVQGEAARQLARIVPHPRLALGTGQGTGGVVKEFRSETAGIVADLAARHRTSSFRVLLAAWLLQLRDTLGTDEVTLGIPMHGRVHWRLRGEVGNFVTVVPVAFRIDGADTVEQVLTRVGRELDVAEERMDVPFAAVARAAGSQNSDGTDVVDLTFGEQLDLALDLDGIPGRPIEPATGHAMFGLSAAFRAGPALTGRVEFRESAIDEAAVDGLVAGFFARLQAGSVTTATVVDACGAQPRPSAEPVFQAPAVVAPSQGSEAATAWREVLGLDHVEDDDDFFELGGDSLHAQMIVARLQEAGLELGIDEFFSHPCLGEQQNIVDSRRKQAGS